MFKTTIKIDGMMCSMCEAHINDAIRSKLSVNKIKSSHKKGETVIISNEAPLYEDIEKALDGSGYRMMGLTCETYEKKGLFGL